MGKSVIQFSLRTSNKAEAKKLREAWDVRLSAEFERADKTTNADIERQGIGPRENSDPLSEPFAIRLVRDYVERLDRRFQDRLASDGPESEEQRGEMIADVEYGVQILKNRDDPRGPERVQAVAEKLLIQAGRTLEDGGMSSVAFDALVQRGLLEVDFRKLARLADDHSRRSLDPLFDPSAPPPLTFAELADQYWLLAADEAAASGTSQKSVDRQRANIALLRQLVGDATLVSALDYDACLALRSLLARVPANLTKTYGGLSLQDAIQRAEAAGRPGLSAITQGQYLGTFRDVLDLAAKKRLIPVNPADGLKPLKRDDLSPSEKRLPFTPSQLAAFFHSEFYMVCAASGSAPYRHDRTGGWRYWLPALSLFTGLRPRELLQLHVEDVRQTDGGTLYLDVTASEADDDDPAPKTLKTRSSRRRVPLHPVLLRLGFMAFVADRQRAADEPRLFPRLKENKYGDPSWYPLKRFNEAFLPKEIPEKQPRQVFYSFRHTFRDGLRAIGASPDVLQALGWSQGNRVVSDHYGSGLNPDQLFEVIRRLAFKGLDLKHLFVNK